MNRTEIFAAIEKEREYQDSKWGTAFDDKNTVNDWVTYLVKYIGNAVQSAGTFAGDPGADESKFRSAIMKVATLCVAILERKEYAPRHYDN